MSNEIRSQMKNSCQGSTNVKFKSEAVAVGDHEALELFAAALPFPLAPGPLSGWLHLFFWVESIYAIAHCSGQNLRCSSDSSRCVDVGSDSMDVQ